jgi:hypothetical protein
MRTALTCAAALVATALAAPAAAAGPDAPSGTSGTLRPAPAAEQPALRGAQVVGSKASSAQGAAAVATASTGPLPGCAAVSIASTTTAPAGGYLPLSLFGIAPFAIGDDASVQFSVPEFLFNGQVYDHLQVDSNGYLQPGTTAVVTINNQNLPDATVPNNVLAPFWTDLNPAAAGELRIGTLTDGNDTWIVVDWSAVREFSTASNLHSFEIWIGIREDDDPGPDITYVYGPNLGNGDGGFLTVGAENFDGTSGGTTYFNGTGSLPTNGTQLRVTSPSYPTFSATPTSGDEPLHVDFDASATGDNTVSYAWDFDDGATGTGVTTSHDYLNLGSDQDVDQYWPLLTVSDNTGKTCSVSTARITVVAGFSVNDVSVSEAAGTATFTVSRSPAGPATVDVTTTQGTAHTPSDYTAAPTTLTFGAGETSKTYVVTINQDTADEPNENYTVRLSNAVGHPITDGTGRGTIVDDDPAPRLTVNDVNVVEGNSGTKNLTFTVRLNRASGKTVTVTARTATGSARAPGDFQAKTVTLTFAPGQTAKSVAVAVVGDRVREPNETFFLLLNNAGNATIADASGTGGIINND